MAGETVATPRLRLRRYDDDDGDGGDWRQHWRHGAGRDTLRDQLVGVGGLLGLGTLIFFGFRSLAGAVREGAAAGNNIAGAVLESASIGAAAANNIAGAVREGAAAGNNIGAAVRDVTTAMDAITVECFGVNVRGRDHAVRAQQALLLGRQQCPVCHNMLVVVEPAVPGQ